MPQPTRPSPTDHLPKRVLRTPGDFGRGHLKVDNLLREEDRDAYLGLLRRPGTTGLKAWQWLRDRGYDVGHGAVKHHKRRFDQQLQEVRTSAEMSLVCADLVRQVGVNRMSDAAVLRFEALLTEQLFNKYQSGEKIDPKEWESLGRALTHAVTNRTKVETVRLAAEKAERGATKGAKRIDGVALSDKVRRILGMPVSAAPTPALPPPSGGDNLPPSPGTPGEGRGEGPAPSPLAGEGWGEG